MEDGVLSSYFEFWASMGNLLLQHVNLNICTLRVVLCLKGGAFVTQNISRI